MGAVRRNTPLAMVLAIGLVAGFALARVVREPAARAQTPNCSPRQSVPADVPKKITSMDKRLNKLIEDYGNGEVGQRELGQRTDTIIAIKHDMMGLFPQVFGYDYKTVYSLLRLVDNWLIDTTGDRITHGDKAVMNDLEGARDAKRQLEGLLLSSPCGVESPSPTPSPT